MNKKLIIRRIVFAVLLILWLYLIFSMSADTGEESAGLSGSIAKFVVKFIPGYRDSSLARQKDIFDITHLVIRKCAHFTEFGILSVLFAGFLRTFDKFRKESYLKTFAAAVIFAGMCAAFDEFHQSFVPGRGPAIRDVMIDTAGALCFQGLSWLIVKFTKNDVAN